MGSLAIVRNPTAVGRCTAKPTEGPTHTETETPVMIRTDMNTPVGWLHITVTTMPSGDEAVASILWPSENGRDGDPALSTSSPEAGSVLARTVEQLNQYFAGERTAFDLPLAPIGTPFQLEAWEALRRIPFGETRSYAGQAAIIGKPTAVRAIGAANGRNPISIVVPCHRVIGANGSLTGFAGGLDAKRWLLNHERRVSGQTLL
jgi:methylated-DNA-[protein]-cysteine S-methyltransferase